MDTKSKQKTKAPKPYTAYTIFWRLERLWIIRERECKDARKTYASFNPYHFDPLELEYPRPAKYKDLILPPYWYSSLHKRNRKHRKQEGSISKSELTALISKSWHNVEPEIFEYCTKIAEAAMQKPKQIAGANDGHGHSTVKQPHPFPKRPVLLPQSLLKPVKSSCPVSLSQSTKVKNQSSSSQIDEGKESSNANASKPASNHIGDFILTSVCSPKDTSPSTINLQIDQDGSCSGLKGEHEVLMGLGSSQHNSQTDSINDELEASSDPESLLFDVSNVVNDDMIQFDFTNGAF
jgi:hypothetical protein